MKKGIIRIVTWLGIAVALTFVAFVIWAFAFGGSQSTGSLKWFQFIQTTATFLLPPVLCALLWDEGRKPFRWLQLDRAPHWSVFLMAFCLMLVAEPAINLLADLNNRIQLPECMAGLEALLRSYETDAEVLTKRFLAADHIGILLVNIGLMALLPALAEEFSFRGTLQQILGGRPSSAINYRTHVAIWVTAILFSAIHMQFFGFVPRMLLGALFGYVFVWTGSLWIPVLMHFTNNALAVLVYYVTYDPESMSDSTKIADTFGAGNTWWAGVISLILTCLGLLIFYRRTHKQ